MTLETQPRGDVVRYRINPRNRREVQRQPQPGARWEPCVLAASEADAQAVLLRLARRGEGGGV